MWRKSSKSDSGDCVELRQDLRAVRDSKAPGQALEIRGLPKLIELLKLRR
jgi:Domain of unknown function (DUF397)